MGAAFIAAGASSTRAGTSAAGDSGSSDEGASRDGPTAGASPNGSARASGCGCASTQTASNKYEADTGVTHAQIEGGNDRQSRLRAAVANAVSLSSAVAGCSD